MNRRLRQAEVVDAPKISALVQAGFNAFVAPDWEVEAQQVFIRESSAERLASLIPEAAFALVAEHEGELVGVIVMSSPRLLTLLFTDAAWLRRGIARELWEVARKHIETEHPSVKTVELNSSPYAVNAYQALGFYPISEPIRRGGCLAIRMACWLPGRALLRNDNAA